MKEISEGQYAACEELRMLIQKFGCEAENVGIDSDLESGKEFIAVINLCGKEADIVSFQQFITNEEHGKINGFPVQFFFRETLH
jgi:hypothetical protein